MIEVVCVTQTADARSILTLPKHMTRSFPLRVVKGIEIPGSSPSIAPGTRRVGTQEEAMILTDDKAERLGEFVSRIIVKGEKIYNNCVSFVAYLAGGLALDAARPDMTVVADCLNEVHPERLVSGDAHIVFLADQKTAVHGIVGVGNPAEHLAVWGANSPLAFGSNADMLETYNAAHILKAEGMLTLEPTR